MIVNWKGKSKDWIEQRKKPFRSNIFDIALSLSFFLFFLFFFKKNFLDFTILSMLCFLRNSPFLHVQVVLTCFSSIYENFKNIYIYIYIYICSIATKNFHISVKCEQMKIKETWKNLRFVQDGRDDSKSFHFQNMKCRNLLMDLQIFREH